MNRGPVGFGFGYTVYGLIDTLDTFLSLGSASLRTVPRTPLPGSLDPSFRKKKSMPLTR